MRSLSENDEYHRHHAYMLPDEGSVIISPITGGAYQIGAHFAQGGFSHIYSCTDDWGHDLVAKVLKPIGECQETQARAVSEVLAQSIVRSPHIVQVFDTFVFRGAYYIISERCASTLREMMEGEYSPRVWFPSLAKALLHALHFMHSQQLGHCDIHPGNIFLHFIPDALLPEDQSALIFKLGDFGLTRPLAAMRVDGTFHKDFAPPETLDPTEFGPLDHRSDIYQAGLVLLNFLNNCECRFTIEEMLEGRPRCLAETLQHPAGEIIAMMLRRHSHARPMSAIDTWRNLQNRLKAQ